MLILAIETSCDETSVAVVKNGQEVLSNVVASQVEFHQKYGGIVPEIASRKHVEIINLIIQEALEKAKITFKDINAVAVTYGPGLVGSLLVGICAAKAIAWAINAPLVGVNHLEGHIYANFLNPKSEILNFPFICLIVSGGHTTLVLVEDHGKYKTLGRTRDDAAGEAFDKIARFLNIGYPGGPIIDELAQKGNPNAIEFKRPMIEREFEYDFSFSGIKTAVVNFVHRQSSIVHRIPDLVASFQQAVVDVLVEKTIRAAKEFNCQSIALAGGVSANSTLRKDLEAKAKEEKIKVHIPPVWLCTDNAAMIACAAYYKMQKRSDKLTLEDLKIEPIASLRL